MKFAFLAVMGLSVLSIGVNASANTIHASFVDVPGSVSVDGWNQMNRTGMGGGDQTTATNAFVSGFGSNVAGSGDGVMTRLSGSVYPAGAGLYGNGVITLTDATVESDLKSLTFQGIINNFDAAPFGLALSYNGGSQALVPSLVTSTSTGGVEDYYRYSWDLAGIAETIDSYAITLTLGFTQSLAYQVDQVAVPEPAALTLTAVGVCALVVRGRRR